LSYPQSDVFIVVFAVIEPGSFENALKKVFYLVFKGNLLVFAIFSFIKWCPELEENARNVPKLFVGNKIDLREENTMNPSGKPTSISFQTVFTINFEYFSPFKKKKH